MIRPAQSGINRGLAVEEEPRLGKGPKRGYHLFQQISADTKDLDDIPHYWPQMQVRGLPTIQYTAGEGSGGKEILQGNKLEGGFPGPVNNLRQGFDNMRAVREARV